ncbi:MAG: ABC transporter substrate-binding protein [Acetanaerobacterium sp.]
MKTLRKRAATTITALMLTLCMLALSACGSTTPAPKSSTAPESDASAVEESGGDPVPTELKKIIIAEPVHLIGYLPMYVAQHEGYFAEQGLEVEVIQATGGTHVTAVVSGDAWGVIGGVESNALANKNSADPIVSFVNVVNRANVYLVAAKGTGPASGSDEDLKAFFQDKKIIAGRHGGSPNLLTRYLLINLGLDPETDVEMLEPADAATVVAMIQNGQGDIGNGAEPQIIQGMAADAWDEPFYKFPDLGDFSYSVLSAKKSTIENDPETVQKFTNAIMKALVAVQEDRALAEKNLKIEFPTLTADGMKASLDRAYEDNLWSLDGFISEQAVTTDMDVLMKTGIYDGEYSYDTLVDMQFVENANK